MRSVKELVMLRRRRTIYVIGNEKKMKEGVKEGDMLVVSCFNTR